MVVRTDVNSAHLQPSPSTAQWETGFIYVISFNGYYWLSSPSVFRSVSKTSEDSLEEGAVTSNLLLHPNKRKVYTWAGERRAKQSQTQNSKTTP